MEKFIIDSFHIHLGPNAFRILGTGLEPFLLGAAVLLVFGWFSTGCHKRKIFIRI